MVSINLGLIIIVAFVICIGVAFLLMVGVLDVASITGRQNIGRVLHRIQQSLLVQIRMRRRSQ